ncbi:hypothetical protein EDD18DRAFT_1109626 [Armillaria luteobubalina]|uniref:Uncharacterized protein n=1 Tax=Armillaria luteobubalina TaxID=153913 RepID=A0AA39PT49_9AGAR|nr:hypothetical protein EDD18DRAFT_1109626 [Armillaria luteobubalina]
MPAQEEVRVWNILQGLLASRLVMDMVAAKFSGVFDQKMAPHSWCTPEQSAWFASCLVKFHQAHLENTIGTFFGAAIKEFMATWPLPECAEEITGNSEEDIVRWAEQFVHYQKQKNQIEAAIQKAIKHSLRPLTCSQKLMIINKLTQETFQAESEEVKAKVFEALEQLHDEQSEALQKGHWSPEDYLDAIDAAPTVLNCFLNDLALQTGWWFTIIAGGPDPANGGNICMGSFHVGINQHKRNFEDEYTHHSVDPKDSSTCHTTFEEGVIAPYGQFLKTMFSCDQADMEALNETLDDNEREATPEMSGLLSMPHSPPSPPIPSFQPPLTSVPPSTHAPPDSETGIVIPPIPPPIPSFQPELVLPPTKSCEEFDGDDFDPQLFWQDATFGGRSALNYKSNSFPSTLGTVAGNDNAAGDGHINLGIPREQYPSLQPEPKTSTVSSHQSRWFRSDAMKRSMDMRDGREKSWRLWMMMVERILRGG